MKIRHIALFLISICFISTSFSQKYVENLDRGLIAIRSGTGNFISWRLLGKEYQSNIGFNIYRNGTKINSTVITTKTNYYDAGAIASATYFVKSVVSGIEQVASKTVSVWSTQYLRIPLQIPQGGTSPDAVAYTYSPNDASVGDLNGDGEYEIIVKWDPSNSKDNSQSGYTGNVYLDAYTLSGTYLWRIDLGINIRAGAHYTQFLVYDFDCDGKAEIVCKTAPGTKGGDGQYLKTGPASSDNDASDYRTTAGYILSGNEYLTIFNGQTGAEMQTISYIVPRGTVGDWGDTYGNRVDRFLACVTYLDGEKPSMVFTRGYYTRTVLAAFNWNGSALTHAWTFDTGNNSSNAYYGQGNHNLAVGDLDGDGKDEIQFGSMAIDNNGAGLYSTGFKHGDAGHLGDMDPTRPGLEFFSPHEDANGGTIPACDLRDPKTGTVIWRKEGTGDFGRGVCMDIDPNYYGYECWASSNGVFDIHGNQIHTAFPQSTGGSQSINMGIWWDGDLLREILDKTVINKYDYQTEGTNRLYTLYNAGVADNNGTKSNPCLVADILGDWREEVIYRTSTNDALYVFATTIESSEMIYTLMHDVQYREAIAWQNVGYNQQPHPSFYLGASMPAAPVPNIKYVSVATDCNGVPNGTATIDYCGVCSGGNTGILACPIIQAEDACSLQGTFDTNNAGYSGQSFANFSNAIGSSLTIYFSSSTAHTETVYIRYANGGTLDRPCSITVNGFTIVAAQSFASTSTWTQWLSIPISITFKQGMNQIIIASTTVDGGPNIDCFGVSSLLTIAKCINQTIQLQSGWNLVSLNVSPIIAAVTGVFPNSTIVKNQNGFYSTSLPQQLQSLVSIEGGKGYLVYNSIAETLQVSGFQISSSIQINNGIQLVGVPSTTPILISSLGTIMSVKDFSGFYIPGNSQSSLTQLIPGKAYFIEK